MQRGPLDEHSPAHPASGRTIGPWGIGSRLIVGLGTMGLAFATHVDWYDALLGLAVLPAAQTVAVGLRGRTAPPLRSSDPHGPALTVLTVLAFGLLFFALPQAGLLFFGSSVLLATVRGQAGCEVLAYSNWLLRRDDEIYCCLFGPVDAAEAQAKARVEPNQRLSDSAAAHAVDRGLVETSSPREANRWSALSFLCCPWGRSAPRVSSQEERH